jgi:cobalt-zinc-cadmium efflux system outer membrane protein
MFIRIPLRGWFCAMALAIPAACASAAETLTLEQAIARAFAANPSLRAISHSPAIADAEREQAAALPNPELSYLREGSDTRTVQLSQTLELGGKRSARIGVADRQRELAGDAVAVHRAGLLADVSAAYLEALVASQRVELAQAEVDLAAQATSAASRRVAAGKISPLEQTRSSVAEAAARLELAKAVATSTLTRRRLATLCADPNVGVRPTGSDPDVRVRFTTPAFVEAPMPPLHELLARLDDSAALRHARTTFNHAEAQAKLERAKRVPDLTLTLGRKREPDDPARTQTVAGVVIPLPLFDSNKGNMLAALRRTEQARDELEAERQRLHEAVADAWQRADIGRIQVAAITESVLPPAQDAYAAAVKGFELGKFSFLDVLDAQRTLFQARAQYLSALSERYRAIADLQRYIESPAP